MTVGIGIIGAGAIARLHIRSYATVSGARVVAVCDALPGRARALAEELGIPGADDEAEALLARPEVDAVSICTPNDSHAALTIAAARAGKHVLCEKPLALTLADARAMLAAAEQAGVRHMVNFSKRAFPGIVRLKALLEEGALGEPLQIELRYAQSWLLAPSPAGDWSRRVWRLDRRVAGSGVLGDLGSHLIDLAHHLVGPSQSVAAVLATKARRSPAPGAVDLDTLDIDDVAFATMRLAGGAVGVLACSRVAGGYRDDIRLELSGSRGAARFSNARPDRLELCLGDDDLRHWTWREVACPPADDEPPMLMGAFVAAIAEGRDDGPSFVDGVRCQAVMTAIEQAAASGHWQAVDEALAADA